MNVMWKITDFLKRIVTSHNDDGSVTLSYVFRHCGLIKIEVFYLVGVENPSIQEEGTVRLVVRGVWLAV